MAERKGWSLPDLAKRLDTPYGTVYGYDRGDRAIPREFAEKAAKELETTTEKILQNYAAQLDETPVPYREMGIPMKGIPTQLLEGMLSNLSELLKQAKEPQRTHLVRAIVALTDELRARGTEVAGAQVSSEGPLTEEEVLKKVVGEVERPGVIYPRKHKAASTSGKSGGPT